MPTAKKRATKPAGEPPDIRAGLPQLPALYGLKPRAKCLPFRHAEDRLARSRNYWICTTRADGRPHSIPGETVLYRVQPSVVLAWTEKEFPKNATRRQLSSAAPK